MATDILLNSDFTPKVANGDLVVGHSDAQHIDHILRLNKGELKDAPATGVGLLRKLGGALTSTMKRDFERDARLQLQADGAKKVEVEWRDELKAGGVYA